MTGVDNAGKLDFMRSLGADEVIDYRAEDFTRGGPYDLIIDLVARRSVFAYRRALAPGGRYLIVGGTMRALLRVRDGRRGDRRPHGSASGAAGGQARPGAVRAARAVLRRRVGAHPHRPRLRAWSEVPEALAYVGEGQALGKVVVLIDPAADSS